MPNSIVHFEIPADDLKRAKKFYEKAFGWKITDPWNMQYFMVETKDKGKDGINGGLMQRKMPGQPFMNYISVECIDASLKKVEKAGGEGGYAEDGNRRGHGVEDLMVCTADGKTVRPTG